MRGDTMNKMKVKVISVFMVLILMSGFFIPIIAEGAEKGRKAVDGSPIVDFYYNSVTDGKYLYYSPDWSFGLIKRNLKTGKEVVISEKTGVRNLSIHGNKIYFSYSKPSSTNYEPYIFKMDKNGKNTKKLALGGSPLIIGKYIYYIGGKLKNYADRGNDFIPKGIYRMTLDGNNKKKIVSKNIYEIGNWGRKIYYVKYVDSYSNKNYYDLSDSNVTEKIIPSGEYDLKRNKRFKIGNENKVLEGSYKNGKFHYKTIAVFKGEKIEQMALCGNNLIVFTSKFGANNGDETGRFYMINSKGKKILLKKWFLAG